MGPNTHNRCCFGILCFAQSEPLVGLDPSGPLLGTTCQPCSTGAFSMHPVEHVSTHGGAVCPLPTPWVGPCGTQHAHSVLFWHYTFCTMFHTRANTCLHASMATRDFSDFPCVRWNTVTTYHGVVCPRGGPLGTHVWHHTQHVCCCCVSRCASVFHHTQTRVRMHPWQHTISCVSP